MAVNKKTLNSVIRILKTERDSVSFDLTKLHNEKKEIENKLNALKVNCHQIFEEKENIKKEHLKEHLFLVSLINSNKIEHENLKLSIKEELKELRKEEKSLLKTINDLNISIIQARDDFEEKSKKNEEIDFLIETKKPKLENILKIEEEVLKLKQTKELLENQNSEILKNREIVKKDKLKEILELEELITKRKKEVEKAEYEYRRFCNYEQRQKISLSILEKRIEDKYKKIQPNFKLKTNAFKSSI